MNKVWCRMLLALSLNWGMATLAVLFNLSLLFNNSSAIASDADRSGMSATSPASESSVNTESEQSFCEALGMGYREHYNFETHNFNVSICRHGGDWYYYRKSKTEPDRVVLIPAQVVFNEETFKAVDGRTTYFVGINSEGYYSSVMYRNNQIIFEPELKEKSKTAPQDNSADGVEVVNN